MLVDATYYYVPLFSEAMTYYESINFRLSFPGAIFVCPFSFFLPEPFYVPAAVLPVLVSSEGALPGGSFSGVAAPAGP